MRLSRSYYFTCDKTGDCFASKIRIVKSFGSYLVKAWFHHCLRYSIRTFHSLSLVVFNLCSHHVTEDLLTSSLSPCTGLCPASTHSPTLDVPDMVLNNGQPTTIAALQWVLRLKALDINIEYLSIHLLREQSGGGGKGKRENLSRLHTQCGARCGLDLITKIMT